MRYLYTVLLTILSPVFIVRLWWRSRHLVEYRHRVGERFGFFTVPEQLQTPTLWVHAVSVGEALAAVPLIKALLHQYPQHSVCVTTTTPTGSACIRQHFQGQVLHVYLPYDLPWAIRAFVRKIKPNLAVMMETELWPNLYYHLAAQRIPLVLANARLSNRSFKNYLYWRQSLQPMFHQIHQVLAQTEEDAERYRRLGVPAARVQMAGNIKFDLKLPESLVTERTALRAELGEARPIWIAASTHEGEEVQILSAFAKLRKTYRNLLLLLVPRHPDRFDAVAELCHEAGYDVARRSVEAPCTAQTDIYLGDTLGELPLLYSAAEVAFVGGSLVKTGGHNVLEPASVSVPTVVGPHMHNFKQVTQLLLAANAIVQVPDSTALASEVSALLADPTRRQQMGAAGQQVVADNRGALAKHMAVLAEVLSEAGRSK